MTNAANQLLYEVYKQVFDAVPIGLFLIASDRRMLAWNQWMSKNTNILPEQALGQSFQSLFPSQENFRFECALEQALDYENPQVLSSILNGFVVPITLNKKNSFGMGMMQQNIEILPIRQDDQKMALVVIQDVSHKTTLKNTLLSLASRFEQNSLRDSLTGCYNRRFLWQYLEEVLKEAEVTGNKLVCCMFDIDHFKKINDEFGHDLGDEVLISFVKTCQSELRANDKFFRYGGEEFIVVFQNVSLQNAINLANRVRKSLESLSSHGPLNKTITCSGGISYWDPSRPIKKATQLVKEADRALYKAKKTGRNRIVCIR